MKNYKLIIPFSKYTKIEIIYPSEDLIEANLLADEWLKLPKNINVKIEIVKNKEIKKCKNKKEQ